MNEELTNEDKVFSAWLNDAATSVKCVWITPNPEYITRLARMYFEERAKSKVWEFAPITADRAVVYYYVGDTFFGEKTYTRETPKTRARQIAEELFDELSFQCLGRKQSIDAIESALNKYAEESEECSMDYLPQLLSMSLLK